MKIHIITRYLIASLLFPALFWACTAESEIIDETIINKVLPEGTEFSVSFGGSANGLSVANIGTRAAGDDPNQITNLRLLVFDENRRFLYSRKAVLGEITADDKADNEHLPDFKKDGITQMMKFTVSLISSNQKRYIHFIANHTWDGFPQDYFIQGKDDGELIGGMTTDKVEFWRMVEFAQLQPADINEKVFKLLRNNAKVSLDISAEAAASFTYEGFTVYNTPDKATTAPFIFKEDLTYEFPITPDKATIPAEANPMFPQPIAKYENGVDVFEQTNKPDYTGFIIMKGTYTAGGNTTPGYYKIDLTKFDNVTGITSLREIVRNYHYRITVKSILNKGYASIKDAANNPAGNNLFASVELADYPSVSDGKSVLEVDKLGGTYVLAPATFTANVFYTNGMTNVKYYPSWTTGDEYLDDIVRTDNATDPSKGTISINIKKVPTDRTLTYTVNVVGKDPATGALITRKITLYLRKPYDFNQAISSTGVAAGDKVTIKFDVPATMAKTSFPFDVFIETKELTPDLAAGYNNGMILVQKDGKYYYKYTVKDYSAVGTTIKLNFVRNRDNAVEVINLTSPYYNPAIVNLGNFDGGRGVLKYGLETDARSMPATADLKIVYKGVEYDGDTNTTGITVVMIPDAITPGTYRLRVMKDVITDYSQPLTIRYRYTVNNTYGSVTYTTEKTQTIQQWLDNPDQTLIRTQVVVKGRMSQVWNGRDYYIQYHQTLKVNKGTLSNLSNTITDSYYGYGYTNFTLTLSGTDATTTSVVFDSDDHQDPTDPNNDHYRIDITLQDLEGNSYVRMPAI